MIMKTSYVPMRSIFDDFFNESFTTKKEFPVNVKETETDFQIHVAAPGHKKDSFKIEVEENILKISTKVKSTDEDFKSFLRKEFSISSFERSFRLPSSIDSSAISAKYEEGILFVSLPKKKVEKNNRMIEIQ